MGSPIRALAYNVRGGSFHVRGGAYNGRGGSFHVRGGANNGDMWVISCKGRGL